MVEPRFGLDPEKARPAVRASKEPIIRLFSYHDAHPVVLGMVLMKAFDLDWLDWDYEVLRSEIVRHFNATGVSDHNWQKIQAFRVLMNATSPWTEYDVFENIIQALNNNIPDFEIVQMATVSQLLAGVDMINTVRKNDFSEEVAGYVAACAIENGITYLPEPLDFAAEKLSEPMYVCNDCGMRDRDTFFDGRCDVCCERFADDRPLNGKPNPKIPSACGTNISTYLKRDPAKVEERFEELRGLEVADIDAKSTVDVQAAKLVVAHKYRRQRREELSEQLEELKSWVKT